MKIKFFALTLFTLVLFSFANCKSKNYRKISKQNIKNTIGSFENGAYFNKELGLKLPSLQNSSNNLVLKELKNIAKGSKKIATYIYKFKDDPAGLLYTFSYSYDFKNILNGIFSADYYKKEMSDDDAKQYVQDSIEAWASRVFNHSVAMNAKVQELTLWKNKTEVKMYLVEIAYHPKKKDTVRYFTAAFAIENMLFSISGSYKEKDISKIISSSKESSNLTASLKASFLTWSKGYYKKK